MAHQNVQSQEGFLCLPAQSQEHGGDARWPAVTQGELDRAVEGHQPSSRTCICSFVWGGTGGALPEPYKMTSSRLLVCRFLTKLSETDYMRVAWGPTSSSGTCAHCPAPCSSIGIRQRTLEIARSATGDPFSSKMRAGSHWAHVTGVKESGNAVVNIILPVTSSSMTGLAVGRTDLHVIVPWLLLGTGMKSSERFWS